MTAIPVHVDGHWLRVDSARAPRQRHLQPRQRSGISARRAKLVAMLAFLAAIVLSGTILIGTWSGGSTEASPAVAKPPAAEATAELPVGVRSQAALPMPAPPVELAASMARWGAEYGVPISLLEALTWQESRWRPDAMSEAGAIGVGQLMPPTAAALEATIGEDLDPLNADHNVRMAAHLLGTLLITSGDDPRVALAGYAQGAASVQRNGMTATTTQYVDEIMTLFDQFARARVDSLKESR